MKINFGTNRLVILIGEYAIKIPYRRRGMIANQTEYLNALGKSYVAAIKKFGPINIQQRLHNVMIFPLDVDYNDLPKHIQHLYQFRLKNRIQVGLTIDKQWKYFDYEDVKFYQ